MLHRFVLFRCTPPLISYLLQPGAAMAFRNPTNYTLLFFFFFFFFFLSTMITCALSQPGFGGQVDHIDLLPPKKDSKSSGMTNKEGSWRWRVDTSSRRMLIGSRAPTCTYNECRGCRFKCSAEQVPVDAGDPMNSAYRYRCVCHR